MTVYFETNQLFYNGPHGFRNGYSCETALHEIINQQKTNEENELINQCYFP